MNPRQTSREGDPDVTPKRFAETTPPQYPGSDYNFILQGVFDIQKSMGRLEQAVETLKDQQKEQGRKLDGISHKIYAAIVVLLLLGAVIGFFAKFTNDWLLRLTTPASQQTSQPK
ncbi:MAG: hypothetical protein ABSE85_07175 [Candidatus Korobacteraceae bacterium]|jgi:uncharacterized membrane protein